LNQAKPSCIWYILPYLTNIVKYGALSLLYINKGVFFSDFLGNALYFVQLKRDPPQYKPVLDLIGGRTPSPPKIVYLIGGFYHGKIKNPCFLKTRVLVDIYLFYSIII